MGLGKSLFVLICRKLYSFNFEVCNVSFPILGADFISAHDLLVDVKQKQLVHNSIPVVSLISGRGSSIWCFAADFNGPITQEYIHSFYPELLKVDLRTDPAHGVEHSIETHGPPLFSKPR